MQCTAEHSAQEAKLTVRRVTTETTDRECPAPKMRNLVTFLGILLTLNLPAEAEVTKITEDNWRDILVGEWMVEL